MSDTKSVIIKLSPEEFVALSVLKAQAQIKWKDMLLLGAKTLDNEA